MGMKPWKAGSAVLVVVRELIADHHPNLATTLDEIAVIFKEKASKSGGVVVLGKSRKAPSLMELLGEQDYKFIIELAADEWVNLTDTQRKALLDHCLYACKVSYDEKTGNIKYSLRSPDFSFYKEEIQRWGVWQDISTDDDEAQQAAATIEDLLRENDISGKQESEKEAH